MPDRSPFVVSVQTRNIEPGDVVLTTHVGVQHVVRHIERSPVGGHVLHFTDGSAMAYPAHGVAAKLGNVTAPSGHTYLARVDAVGITVIETAPDGATGPATSEPWDNLSADDHPDGTLGSLDLVDTVLSMNGWTRAEAWRIEITENSIPVGLIGAAMNFPESLALVASVIPS